MHDRAQSLLTAILAIVAVAIGVVLVHREFYSASSSRVAMRGLGPPSYISNWKDVLAPGRVIGDTNAPIKIAEFSDLECPVCRRFDGTASHVQEEFPGKVSLIFIHFPLPQHRFARPAARAAECAERFGKFPEFVRLIYQKQDSLGLKSWSSYAQEAGIADSAAFLICNNETATIERLEAGIALGQRLEVTGTPTVIVNGWRYSSPPDEPELTRVVKALLANQAPFTVGNMSAEQ